MAESLTLCYVASVLMVFPTKAPETLREFSFELLLGKTTAEYAETFWEPVKVLVFHPPESPVYQVPAKSLHCQWLNFTTA